VHVEIFAEYLLPELPVFPAARSVSSELIEYVMVLRVGECSESFELALAKRLRELSVYCPHRRVRVVHCKEAPVRKLSRVPKLLPRNGVKSVQ
jgi:hypothetical protein